MSKFSNNNKISLKFMEKNRDVDRHEFKRRTGLGERYFYRARQILEINPTGQNTRVHEIADYIEKNPGVKNEDICKAQKCARTTCSDARNLVDYRKGKDLYGKKSLAINPSKYHKILTMAWT